MTEEIAGGAKKTAPGFAEFRREDIARGFDEDRFGGPVGAYIRNVHERMLWSMIPAPEGRRILDLGAGTGRFTIPLAEKNARVTAVDSSPAMLRIIREKAAATTARVELILADALRLPFKDRSFDIVVSSRMLMHINEWRIAIAEMCRVSANGVIVDFPPLSSFAGLAPIVLPVKKMLGSETMLYKVLPVSAVSNTFKKNGFAVESLLRQFSLPFFLHRRLNKPEISQRIEQFLSHAKVTGTIGAPAMILAKRKEGERTG